MKASYTRNNINQIPSSPGCYTVRIGNESFYVGYTKDLQRRAQNYFYGISNGNRAVAKGVSEAWEAQGRPELTFQFTETPTASEAHALEQEVLGLFHGTHGCVNRAPRSGIQANRTEDSRALQSRTRRERGSCRDYVYFVEESDGATMVFTSSYDGAETFGVNSSTFRRWGDAARPTKGMKARDIIKVTCEFVGGGI